MIPRVIVSVGALCLFLAAPVSAQDLVPRAYANVPVNATFLVWGFGVSHGGVVSDPTLPVTDVNATVETPSVGLAHSFSLFGKTAQVFGALPYSWAQVSGKVLEEARSISRSGLSDMHLRLSVLVRGAPAVSAQEFAKAPRRTILGASLTVVAPTGEFFPDKLINLGTNRWAFKPEFAVSQPFRERWLLDAYGAVWFFTANDAFYPGTGDQDAGADRHVPGAHQLQLHATAVGGVRRDVLRRRPYDRPGSRGQRSAVQLTGRGHARPARGKAALGEAGGEQGGHHPVRRQLHLVLHRVANRVDPASQTSPVSAAGGGLHDDECSRHVQQGEFS